MIVVCQGRAKAGRTVGVTELRRSRYPFLAEPFQNEKETKNWKLWKNDGEGLRSNVEEWGIGNWRESEGVRERDGQKRERDVPKDHESWEATRNFLPSSRSTTDAWPGEPTSDRDRVIQILVYLTIQGAELKFYILISLFKTINFIPRRYRFLRLSAKNNLLRT